MRNKDGTALQQFSNDIIAIVARCRPAVATIRTVLRDGVSSGSGFLIDGTGSVVTNNHVVDGCQGELQIQFATGAIQQGSVVGTDPITDLAIVRATGPLPPPLPVRIE